MQFVIQLRGDDKPFEPKDRRNRNPKHRPFSEVRENIFPQGFEFKFVPETKYTPEIDFRFLNEKISIRGPMELDNNEIQEIASDVIPWLEEFTRNIDRSFEFVFEVYHLISGSKFLIRKIIQTLVENARFPIFIRWKTSNEETEQLGRMCERYIEAFDRDNPVVFFIENAGPSQREK